MENNRSTAQVFFDQIFIRFSMLAILAAALIAFYYFYLTFFPDKIIEYKNIPFPTKVKVIHPGDRVQAYIDFCKYSNILPINKVITLESEINSIPITSIVRKLPKGCRKNYLYDGWIIPVGVPPGTYHVSATIVYRPNNVSVVTATYYTQDFQIK